MMELKLQELRLELIIAMGTVSLQQLVEEGQMGLFVLQRLPIPFTWQD